MAGTGGLAKQVRAGLTETVTPASAPASYLDELFFRKPVRLHLKEFAEIFAFICLVIGDIRLYHYGFTTSVAALFAAAGVLLVLGFRFPAVLHPAWKAWMKLGHILGAVMSTVIMALAWGIMLVPISFLLRALKIKVMDTSFKLPVDSYWEPRDKKMDDFALLRRQF